MCKIYIDYALNYVDCCYPDFNSLEFEGFKIWWFWHFDHSIAPIGALYALLIIESGTSYYYIRRISTVPINSETYDET